MYTKISKIVSLITCFAMLLTLVGCGSTSTDVDTDSDAAEAEATESSDEADAQETSSEATIVSDKEYIEYTLNLANNTDYTWTYQTNSWVMSIVSAVAYPEIEDEEGVSVCVPAAYVTGIDADGDGAADITADNYTEPVNGTLVIDYDAEITSTNGQVYTAATAPVILNTGAAGYGNATNTLASSTYAEEGYINVACGNRGKQDTATDEDGNTYYTGDAPSCLADQKAAARFVKYNILLGNLPGSVDYFVSTGGSGGGAHATMFAATSNNSDFYPYQEEVGAVGCYLCDDGTYTTTVTIDGEEVSLSDGAWGCIAYSAITSLYEADMALAFEYYMDTTYDFGSSFQKQLAAYLSEAYMEYINEQNLTVEESAVGFDLDGDGELNSTIALTIECDPDEYPETNGYHGTYLDLYLAEFTENLEWYLENLDYADGWTWFDEDGNALSDEEVAAMTTTDKAEAFIEGRYTKSSSTGSMSGDLPSGMNGALDFVDRDSTEERGEIGGMTGGRGDISGNITDGELPDGEMGDFTASDLPDGEISEISEIGTEGSGDSMIVGTPDAGTTQSATGSTDSTNYSTYDEMLEAYETDIESILAGDEYGNNIVSLYNPLNYIGDDDTENPTWVRILCGASEGDISMFNSLNLQIAMLNAGIDCNIEWQWDGGHVPSEILGDSFALYVDEMYGEYVSGVTTEKAEAEAQTTNGTSTSATGTDLSSWVTLNDDGTVTFSLASAVAYRTNGASKAMPGFDVIDYGQEDYVFGNTEQDARHWDTYLLEILEEYRDVLEPLFNSGN
ncbi:MAG: hypothetical protein LUH23_04480 [Oscillospiraceae bacterium]|nr:hypothetical protein [Oscillospiraceae bacterium]